MIGWIYPAVCAADSRCFHSFSILYICIVPMKLHNFHLFDLLFLRIYAIYGGKFMAGTLPNFGVSHRAVCLNSNKEYKMKKNIKKSAGGKVSETLLALIDNIKKAAANGNTKRAGALLALLFAGNVAKGLAEEVTGTIVFPPDLAVDNRGIYACYALGVQDDFVADMYMQVYLNNKYNRDDISTYQTLFNYLKKGNQIEFEDEGLKLHDRFEHDRILAIISPDGRRIELTRLFSPDVIKREFPYLYAKLEREKKQQGQGR